MRGGLPLTSVVALLAVGAQAQTPPTTRIAVLQAEQRRAPTAADLATIRAGSRSLDAQTARIALRALGRLERPALIADILPRLGHSLPEARAEAANAAAQAAQGWLETAPGKPADGTHTPTSVLAALAQRLAIEEDPTVRLALCESIGRLPYRVEADVMRAETELVALADRSDTVPDRLGVAKGLEALIRLSGGLQAPSRRAIDTLKVLVGVLPPQLAVAALDPSGQSSGPESRLVSGVSRDARVRRLAFEALTSADAIDDVVVGRGVVDPDPQVRRLASRAAAASGRNTGALTDALDDAAAMVRIEALRGLQTSRDDGRCRTSIVMASDADQNVALTAIDQLADCGDWEQAVTLLESTAQEGAGTSLPRRWHRAAHAIVALAQASPDRARASFAPYMNSEIWQLRMYAARAAALVDDDAVLNTLARDRDDNVVEAALTGLARVAREESTDVFVAALSRPGHQVIRAAAIALEATPRTDTTVAALKVALERLTGGGRADTDAARAALISTLTRMGAPPEQSKKATSRVPSDDNLTAESLRRLAAPRARLIIRDVGVVELALFTSEAPITVLRFAELAQSGYYNGLTFHHVVPNSVVQGGSPGASDYVDHAEHLGDEVGLWPHVRGTVGLSTHGRDTGGAQFFINLVDNPSFDHHYIVFEHILNVIDVIYRILEVDVIERV
jgi:peptidyl-prolyl cis-trans isomerase B (cyclophilin B)